MLTSDATADKVDIPLRALDQPLRFPVSNVFRSQSAVSSGLAVAGRLCSGVVQVGETVQIVPGNQTAAIRSGYLKSLHQACRGESVFVNH